jgi:hypothetical protein
MIPCFDKHDFMILITARHAGPSDLMGQGLRKFVIEEWLAVSSS